MGGPLEMFTGDKTRKYDGGVTSDATVLITHDGPFPLNVTSVILKGQTYEGAG
jgi:hypothetical protein